LVKQAQHHHVYFILIFSLYFSAVKYKNIHQMQLLQASLIKCWSCASSSQCWSYANTDSV